MASGRAGPSLKAAAAIAAGLALTSCATPKEKLAFSHVNALVAERTNVPVVWHRDDASRAQADEVVRTILRKRVHADGAVRLAFLRNPSIQASLAAIGISEADVAQAGRLKNPVISIERVAGNGILEIERQILFSVLSLFTIGPRTKIAKDQAERARYLAALEIVQAAGTVRAAWVEAVAARERLVVMKRIFESAKAAEDLAERMAVAGSMTEIDQAKIKVALAEIAGQRGQLRAAAEIARERLIRAMGLWGKEIKFKLPWSLPRLPRRARKFGDLERVALTKRLDIRAAKREVDLLRKTLGLTKFTSVVSLLEVGANWNSEREREDGETRRADVHGFELEFAIPIFDPGDAKVSRAKWTYMQAVERLKSQAITARSEAREAFIGYRSAHDLARHYQRTIVPLRAKISEEELLQYNGMLASIFELLAATRQHAQATLTALDARRDFWLSDGRMDAVLLAGGGMAPGGGDVMVAEQGGDEEH